MHASTPLTRAALTAGILCLLLPVAAHAVEPVVAPGAGSLLQQTQPVEPPAPSPAGTGLTIEAAARAALPPSEPFLIATIQLSGNTLFDTPTLHALVASAEGKHLTLPELGAVVARISDYYHRRGYPLARALIPAQTIQNGRVRIEVIEARYGAVLLDNHSRVSAPLLQATLSPVHSGDAISEAPLDHTLLLLSDVPGVSVAATLKPGAAVGTSDLQVATAATAAVTGNVALDNDGNRYTGRARLGGTVNFIAPLRHGDVLGLTGLTSGDMNYGSAGYETLLNGAGTRMGGSYSALHYVLGGTLAALDGHCTAVVDSLWLKQPLLRSPNANVYAQIQYDHKVLDDEIGTGDIRTDRHMDNWTASVTGDLRDTLLSGGVNTWNLGWTMGNLAFGSAAAARADAATANTQGGFSLWIATLSRLQNLSTSNALYFAVSAQWANSNLDPAEKMIAGGAYTVRSYDMGALSGDSGILGSAEFRQDLGVHWRGQWQAVVFADRQHVTINHNVWAAGTNSATLNGAGVGCNWSAAGQWSAKAYIAAPLGPTPSLVGSNNSTRAWVSVSKGFY